MCDRVSPGRTFREAIASERPLQIVGTINAYCALLARQAGHRAIYLSGAGVANASFGLPDLGITCRSDVLEDARRITGACDLPLLVDIDTGWGEAFSIDRTVKEMIRAGVAAVHIEDQVSPKRCGHRPNKALVSKEEMVDRIKAAVDARTDSDFVIMARTDALASEGLSAALERAYLCVQAGADCVFAEAMTELVMYRMFADVVGVPLLANMTEFGKTPLFTKQQLADVGVAMVLYPLSAFRAMSRAALTVYETISREGSQESVLGGMQSRAELYDILRYHDYERKLDQLFAEKRHDHD
ncbi:methylisocitrate lyase [Geobacter hydrogenophilus]|uniref:2-methylisocitrate lyase n=1 Tax=Geobacter hydrogenophilus TaxID=40983 RepID=A0A9W6FZC4_9BACT|nr:methylisocitrate lyase [Geobacter hydrogenophilus]MBT0893741.1 methylisocitrate lyase [Geobacter hydrogenophilus]GLI37563.1 2-methylisocitrate lyase [Geobacter hydrogenophilus]